MRFTKIFQPIFSTPLELTERGVGNVGGLLFRARNFQQDGICFHE